jgi:dienelactone hydrolase
MWSSFIKPFVLLNGIVLISMLNGYAQGESNKYVLLKDILYATSDTLKADLYLPADYKQQKNSVLIFIDGLGTDFRKWDHYTNWAKFAASYGYIGVIYASRPDYSKSSFKNILDFLSANDDQYFIDPAKIAVYAGSGNVVQALPLANEDTRVKAALIFYGTAKMKSFRLDMPVLLVRAGFDNVQLNKDLDTLAFQALAANAPYTISNFNTAVHAFEDFTGNTAEQKFLEQSLDFLKRNMQADAQKNLAANTQEMVAVRELYQSNWKSAFDAYTKVLQSNPGNNEAERQLGNICIEMKEYSKALNYYNNSLAHGNWRKGEIAVKKIYAYAKLENTEAAVSEMYLLKKIGWFNEKEYTGKEEYKQVVQSASYRKFINEK